MPTPTPTPTPTPSPGPTPSPSPTSVVVSKLKALGRTPRARAAIDKARQQAARPENRRRIEALRSRLTGRH